MVISLFLIQKTIPTQIIFFLLFDGLICSVCDLSSNKQLLYNFKYYLTYQDLRVLYNHYYITNILPSSKREAQILFTAKGDE